MRKIAVILLVAVLGFASCCRFNAGEARYTDGPIWPDYMDVTVPRGIAPLNFCYTGDYDKSPVTTFTCGSESVSIKGAEVVWKEKDWSRILAAGEEIVVHSSVLDEDWKIFVSDDEIDYGLNYRRIAPGYESYSKMGIYERCLGSYDESALIENTEFDGCVNCHSYNRGDPVNYSLHIRGAHGASIISNNGTIDSYNTKTEETLGFCVYPYWHPGGRYIVYSTNSTRQGFHVKQDKLIEVFDLASDLQIYDLQTNELILSPSVKAENVWETFPCFSADGKTLYFCAASAKTIPEEVEQIRYNLCKVDFYPEEGRIGTKVDTVVFAEQQGKSVSFPRPSYDGRFLVYTLSDYGNFSIWHHEADLWMMDLSTGETRPMDNANSNDTESYHSWSSNSRWMVFSSRRDDGLYTRLYFTHIDEDGNETKAFMLPQKHPLHFYSSLNTSYNVPEFVTGPVNMDKHQMRNLINKPDRKPFGFRWSEE